MKNILPIILIIVGLFCIYEGYNRMQDTATLKIGDLKIEAGANGGKESAYIFYGLGALCLIGGLVVISKKGKSV